MSHLLFKVTVTFSSFTSNVFMSALLLDDALKPAMSLTNAVINQRLRQIDPLSDDHLFQLVVCRELSTLMR